MGSACLQRAPGPRRSRGPSARAAASGSPLAHLRGRGDELEPSRPSFCRLRPPATEVGRWQRPGYENPDDKGLNGEPAGDGLRGGACGSWRRRRAAGGGLVPPPPTTQGTPQCVGPPHDPAVVPAGSGRSSRSAWCWASARSTTGAYWTDDVSVTGITLATGRLDLKVEQPGQHHRLHLAEHHRHGARATPSPPCSPSTTPATSRSPSTATSTRATDPDGKALRDALTVKVTSDATVTGTSPSAACSNAALAGTGTSLNGSLVDDPAHPRRWGQRDPLHPGDAPERGAELRPGRDDRGHPPVRRGPGPVTRPTLRNAHRRPADAGCGAGRRLRAVGGGQRCCSGSARSSSSRGSMSPTIETGALAWAQQVPAADLEVGDVVMVHTAEGDRVTHRIVAHRPHDRYHQAHAAG